MRVSVRERGWGATGGYAYWAARMCDEHVGERRRIGPEVPDVERIDGQAVREGVPAAPLALRRHRAVEPPAANRFGRHHVSKLAGCAEPVRHRRCGMCTEATAATSGPHIPRACARPGGGARTNSVRVGQVGHHQDGRRRPARSVREQQADRRCGAVGHIDCGLAKDEEDWQPRRGTEGGWAVVDDQVRVRMLRCHLVHVVAAPSPPCAGQDAKSAQANELPRARTNLP